MFMGSTRSGCHFQGVKLPQHAGNPPGSSARWILVCEPPVCETAARPPCSAVLRRAVGPAEAPEDTNGDGTNGEGTFYFFGFGAILLIPASVGGFFERVIQVHKPKQVPSPCVLSYGMIWYDTVG